MPRVLAAFTGFWPTVRREQGCVERRWAGFREAWGVSWLAAGRPGGRSHSLHDLAPCSKRPANKDLSARYGPHTWALVARTRGAACVTWKARRSPHVTESRGSASVPGTCPRYSCCSSANTGRENGQPAQGAGRDCISLRQREQWALGHPQAGSGRSSVAA